MAKKKTTPQQLLTRGKNPTAVTEALFRLVVLNGNKPMPLSGRVGAVFLSGKVTQLAQATLDAGLVEAVEGSSASNPLVVASDAGLARLREVPEDELAPMVRTERGALQTRVEDLHGAVDGVLRRHKLLASVEPDGGEELERAIADLCKGLEQGLADQLEAAVASLATRVDRSIELVESSLAQLLNRLNSIRSRVTEPTPHGSGRAGAEVSRPAPGPARSTPPPSGGDTGEHIMRALAELERSHVMLGGSISIPTLRDHLPDIDRDAFDRSLLELSRQARVVIEIPSDGPPLERPGDALQVGDRTYYYVFRRPA